MGRGGNNSLINTEDTLESNSLIEAFQQSASKQNDKQIPDYYYPVKYQVKTIQQFLDQADKEGQYIPDTDNITDLNQKAVQVILTVNKLTYKRNNPKNYWHFSSFIHQASTVADSLKFKGYHLFENYHVGDTYGDDPPTSIQSVKQGEKDLSYAVVFIDDKLIG
jgi:hypothetical protein